MSAAALTVGSMDSLTISLVTIAGQPTRARELTPSQASGEACIQCGTASSVLLPVGVVYPPPTGSAGIAAACSTCAQTGPLTPSPSASAAVEPARSRVGLLSLASPWSR